MGVLCHRCWCHWGWPEFQPSKLKSWTDLHLVIPKSVPLLAPWVPVGKCVLVLACAPICRLGHTVRILTHLHRTQDEHREGGCEIRIYRLNRCGHAAATTDCICNPVWIVASTPFTSQIFTQTFAWMLLKRSKKIGIQNKAEFDQILEQAFLWTTMLSFELTLKTHVIKHKNGNILLNLAQNKKSKTTLFPNL